MIKNSSFRNYARLETEQLPWPEVIADPEGDLRRALRRSEACARFWRAAFLFTAAVLACVVALVMLGVL